MDNYYRAWAIHGRRMNAGVSADGRLFIGELQEAVPSAKLSEELRLGVDTHPAGGLYEVRLQVFGKSGEQLA